MKKCLWTCTECADWDYPVHAQNTIQAFALHSYILCLSILLVDRECPYQSAQSDCCSNAVPGLRCPHMSEDMFSHDMAYIYINYWKTCLIPYHACPNIWTSVFYFLLMCLKTAGFVANRVDPDQMPDSTENDLCLNSITCVWLENGSL